MSAPLILVAPLAGWVAPLAEVPDPVFAERMAGDGVAIDPVDGQLYAPCAGEVVAMPGAQHAVTLRTAGGIEILLHVGIDTVQMKGEGFEMLASPGAQVAAGAPLLRFDLDLVARRARSPMTPVLVAAGGIVLRRAENILLKAGDFLMEVAAEGAALAAPAGTGAVQRAHFSVPFDHGLHARPAAQIAGALRAHGARVAIVARGRSANARSTVALMGLGVRHGEVIEVVAEGGDAAAALAALAALFGGIANASGSAPTPVAAHAQPHTAAPRSTGVVRATAASRGLAVGTAAQLAPPEIAVAESGAGAAQESAALHAALDAVARRIDARLAAAHGEQQAVLAAHAELIRDPQLVDSADALVGAGKGAGFAWRNATRTAIATLEALDDVRMGERAADLRDIEYQVLHVLGGGDPAAVRELADGAIVIADELLPSQLFALDRARVRGICMARGGPTSHVALIAAALGIPALVAAGAGVLGIPDGTPLILDAEAGSLEIDPPPAARDAMARAVAARAAQHAADLAAAAGACVTRDAVRITVCANLGAFAETAPAVERGAEGCGLLRTEFLFLDRNTAPDEDEQVAEYQRIAEALGGRPLTIRTLDMGGDKPIPYLPLPHEDNPALGLRGLRTGFARPDLLRTQLAAILRVRAAGPCRILLPMVTDLADVRAVRALLADVARERGVATLPAVGVMVETPASALLAGQLVREADFMSIGTNDLSQYTLAIDRGHPQLGARLDALHPAVLRLIAMTAEAAHAHGKEAAVCGGLASDPAAIPVLVGLGIRELSVVPGLIPSIKQLVRTLDAAACAALARDALALPGAPEVRALVAQWMAAHAVAVVAAPAATAASAVPRAAAH